MRASLPARLKPGPTKTLSVGLAMALGAGAALGSAAAQQPGTAQRAAAAAPQQNFDNVQIDAVKVTDNIYMLVGAGGNVTVQFGPEGVLVVDTSYGPMSSKILAVIKKLSDPAQFLPVLRLPPAHAIQDRMWTAGWRERLRSRVNERRELRLHECG